MLASAKGDVGLFHLTGFRVQDAKVHYGSSEPANLRRLRPLYLAEDHTRSYFLQVHFSRHPNTCAGDLLGQKGERTSRISQRYVCFDLPMQ